MSKTTTGDKACDKPDVLARHGGKCSDEQVLKCHGREMLEKLKEANK